VRRHCPRGLSLVEVPDHIWREMENRPSTGTEQENAHASELRQRQKSSHSQPSPMLVRLHPWPREKVSSLHHSPHDLTDIRTTAPTMPRRRESLSTASTLDDDMTTVLNERPASGQSRPPPRIPLELQQVFLQSQAGLKVEVPPTNFTVFQEHRCRETARQGDEQ
jgi:hypothetical protein